MSAPIFPTLHRRGPTMQAAVYTRFGPPQVLHVREVLKPTPKSHELRVRVHATTVTAACGMMRRGDTLMARVVLGLTGPRARFQIPGIEFAGVVDAIGTGVTGWSSGERVFGFSGFSGGAYGEYCCVPAAGSVARIPQKLDFGEAASLVDGPTTALYFLQHLGGLKNGDRVLVIGASGSVGGAAVQVARELGARVTGVCSTHNVGLVRSLGADAVLDYTRSDLASGNRLYDIVFDAVTKSTFLRSRRVLAKGGRYLPTVPRLRDYALVLGTRFFGQRRVRCGFSVDKRTGLGVVAELVEKGALRPVIDRRYPLHQIADAHGYVDTGRKRGNVVIDMPPVA